MSGSNMTWNDCQHRSIAGLYILLLLNLLIVGCATVPYDIPKTHSTFITDTSDTHFGRHADTWAVTHGEASGFFPIGQGMDALGARLRLLEKAERTVDLQYFLMILAMLFYIPSY